VLACLVMALTAATGAHAAGGPAPGPLWVRTVASSPREEGFVSAVAGRAGSVYCAGFAGAHDSVSNLLVARYDASGKRLWKRTWRGPQERGAAAWALAATPAGGVVVAGETGPTTYGAAGREQDILVVKYSAAGERRWTKVVAGSAGRDDWAERVVLDRHGSAYVLCSACRKATGRDYLVVKLSSSGRVLWKHWCGGRFTDTPADIIIDAAQNTYVTGDTWNASPAHATTICIDRNGRRVWTRRLRVNGGAAHGSSLALAPNGALYVTGWCAGISGLEVDQDMMLARLNARDGRVAWVKQAGATTSAERGADVAVDPAGDAVVAGGGDEGVGALVWKWQADGTLAWERQIPPAVAHSDAWFGRLQADAQGNVYCAGATEGPTQIEADNHWTDVLVAKYAATGDLLWSATYNGPRDMRDECNALVLTADGVYLAGSRMESATHSGAVDSSALLIKYPLD
jgi:hypothetical protein